MDKHVADIWQLTLSRFILTVQSVILMFEMLISMRIVLHVLVVPLLTSLVIALFKISTPDKQIKK